MLIKIKDVHFQKKGKQELDMSLNQFFETFFDVDEMRSYRECHRH